MAGVRFECPSCSQVLIADATALRTPVRCARCEDTFRPIDVLGRGDPIPAIPVGSADDVSSAPAEAKPLSELAMAAKAPPLRAKPALASPLAGADVSPEEEDDFVAALQDDLLKLTGSREADPKAPAPHADNGGGTVINDPGDAEPVAAPLRGIPLELRALAQQLLDLLEQRLGRRLKPAIIAVPAVSLLALLLLGLCDAAGWRWMAGTVALLTLTATVGLGAAIALTRLLPPPPFMAILKSPAPRPLQFQRALAGVSALVVVVLAGGVVWAVGAATAQPEPAGAATTDGGSTAVPSSASALPQPSVSETRVSAGGPKSAVQQTALRADAELDRKQRVVVLPGVLIVPASFESADGSYDLLLHFAGNSDLVEQSVAAAKLNALVHVSNIARDATPYRQHFQGPRAFALLLEQINDSVEKKLGLKKAALRRVALSSWSVGYGAVSQIAGNNNNADRVDALLLMEGVHARYVDGAKSKVDSGAIAPLMAFAKRAAQDKKLLVITHSEIAATEYASSGKVADVIIEELGAKREQLDSKKDPPPQVDLPAVKAFAANQTPAGLVPQSTAQMGSFLVLGYSGKAGEHYRSHLIQMSVTVLPRLVERWQ
jgi:hypothetical protein